MKGARISSKLFCMQHMRWLTVQPQKRKALEIGGWGGGNVSTT